MSIFPSGSEWNGVDIMEAFHVSLYPMAFVGIFINFIGVVGFYSIKRHRAFPASVLAWIGIVNIIYCIFLLFKWTPGSVSMAAIALTPSPPVCLFSLWIDLADYYSIVSLDTLIALTLYLSVCKRVEMDRDTNKWYFWGYVAFFWIVIIVAPTSLAFSPGVTNSNGACHANKQVIYGAIIPQIVMIAFQLFCVGSSILQARQTIAASSSVRTKADSRMIYMVVRFTLTIVNQIMLVTTYYIIQLVPVFTPKMLEAALMCFGLCVIFDGAILLFGNRALMKKVMRKVRLLSGDTSSGTTNSDKSVNMKSRPTTTSATSGSTGTPHLDI